MAAYPAVFQILGFKRTEVTIWPFKFTWRHRSHDHTIR